MSDAEIWEQRNGGLRGEGLSKAQSGGPGLGGGRRGQRRLIGLGNQSRKYQVRLEELEDDRLGSEERGGWALGPEGPVLWRALSHRTPCPDGNGLHLRCAEHIAAWALDGPALQGAGEAGAQQGYRPNRRPHWGGNSTRAALSLSGQTLDRPPHPQPACLSPCA